VVFIQHGKFIQHADNSRQLDLYSIKIIQTTNNEKYVIPESKHAKSTQVTGK